MTKYFASRLLAGGAIATLLCSGAGAADILNGIQPGVPDFSSNNQAWINVGTIYGPVPGEKYTPVYAKKGYLFCGNTGRGPECGDKLTPPEGDYTNPILTPWAASVVKQWDEDIDAGKQAFESMSRCWPGGVPGMLIFTAEPVFYLQMPKEVTILYSRGPNIRHIYMNQAHSKNPAPTWYGESVGRYEGQDFVVDTIGTNDKTFVDWFHVPHSTKLHTVERYTKLPEADMWQNSMFTTHGSPVLQIDTIIEDPVAFTVPWKGRRSGQLRTTAIADSESICAENNDANYFNEDQTPVPQTKRPDF